MAATLEERLRKLEDIEEIRSLLTAYGRLLDERDLAAYAALFARNGTWTGPYIGSAEGPQAIQALLEKNLSAVAGAEPAGAHHIMSNMAIETAADTARRGRGGPMSCRPGAQAGPGSERTLRRCPGPGGRRWRFKSRVVSGDLPGVT